MDPGHRVVVSQFGDNPLDAVEHHASLQPMEPPAPERLGARDVIIAATHGVLSDPAPKRLAECGAREVIVTNTLPIGEDKQFPQLTVLSIAPLLASTIRAVFENGSVTGLFDGSA